MVFKAFCWRGGEVCRALWLPLQRSVLLHNMWDCKSSGTWSPTAAKLSFSTFTSQPSSHIILLYHRYLPSLPLEVNSSFIYFFLHFFPFFFFFVQGLQDILKTENVSKHAWSITLETRRLTIFLWGRTMLLY